MVYDREIRTVLLKKSGSFFYDTKTGERVLLSPDNFHLADGLYFANIKDEIVYGDMHYHNVTRLLRSSLSEEGLLIGSSE